MSEPCASVPFGKTDDGITVELFTLSNASGAKVELTNYGATIVSVWVPDRDGQLADVALGYDDVSKYEKASPYFGATVGRYANRIGGGGFECDGKFYPLVDNNFPNDKPCHLHGGNKGFDKVVWGVKDRRGDSITFYHVSLDGDEGYPGRVEVEVGFTWSDDNELGITYRATSDAKTPINLTNHSYFNLKGSGEGQILDHTMRIEADAITEVDEGSIPTGAMLQVEGTALDFRETKLIGEGIDDDLQTLREAGGYDHNYVLRGEKGVLRSVATATSPQSGRAMEVLTTEPGIQFYSGNFLGEDELPEKSGATIMNRGGLCLETQHFPDSPRQPHFPSTWLSPGEVFTSKTVYRFFVV